MVRGEVLQRVAQVGRWNSSFKDYDNLKKSFEFYLNEQANVICRLMSTTVWLQRRPNTCSKALSISR